VGLAREMPIYHDLIPEIHKLVSIIEDKTLNREDYYQPPIEWEKNDGSNGEDSQDDVGPEVVRFIYTSMHVDEEWSTKSPRGSPGGPRACPEGMGRRMSERRGHGCYPHARGNRLSQERREQPTDTGRFEPSECRDR